LLFITHLPESEQQGTERHRTSWKRWVQARGALHPRSRRPKECATSYSHANDCRVAPESSSKKVTSSTTVNQPINVAQFITHPVCCAQAPRRRSACPPYDIPCIRLPVVAVDVSTPPGRAHLHAHCSPHPARIHGASRVKLRTGRQSNQDHAGPAE